MKQHLLRRFFSIGKKPKAVYHSEPYLNFLDKNERPFLSQRCVRMSS